MKITIGICDDEMIFRDEIRKIVESTLVDIEQEYEVRTFQTGKELVSCKEKFDILLLDIEMPEISGFKLAELVREGKEKTRIIFISNYEEMVFEAIKFQPYRFIRKKKIQNELPEAISSCVKKVIDEGEIISFNKKKAGEMILRSKDIKYIEVYGHSLIVVHQNGSEEVRGTLSNLEKSIVDKNFVRTHKSYLVNMEYVYCILKNKIQLENGKEIPLTRKYDEHVKNRFKFLAGFKID